MSLEFSVWFETLEGVRNGYRSLRNGRPKGRAGRHQWRVDLCGVFVQFPGERAYVSARGDAEIFALKGIFTQVDALLLQELRRKCLDLISRRFQPDP